MSAHVLPAEQPSKASCTQIKLFSLVKLCLSFCKLFRYIMMTMMLHSSAKSF